MEYPTDKARILSGQHNALHFHAKTMWHPVVALLAGGIVVALAMLLGECVVLIAKVIE